MYVPTLLLLNTYPTSSLVSPSPPPELPPHLIPQTRQFNLLPCCPTTSGSSKNRALPIRRRRRPNCGGRREESESRQSRSVNRLAGRTAEDTGKHLLGWVSEDRSAGAGYGEVQLEGDADCDDPYNVVYRISLNDLGKGCEVQRQLSS